MAQGAALRGTPWLSEHTELLKAWAETRTDGQIAQMTGHSTVTVRVRRNALGLGHPKRQGMNWTRLQWLQHDAAGGWT